MKPFKLTSSVAALLALIFLFACAGDADVHEPAPPPAPPVPALTTPAEPVQPPESPLFPSAITDSVNDGSGNEPEPDPSQNGLIEPIDPIAERTVEIIDTMTIYEKICQMLIVSPDAITGVSGTTVAGDVTRVSLEKYPVGGFVHFSPNIISSDQITEFNKAVQEISQIPLLIAADEEGGRVTRLGSKLGAHFVRAMLSYEDRGEEAALENAKILSEALKAHGFNTNFAPVADVLSNPANTVIGNRAYSRDFAVAAELVSAAVRGFNESNIACSLKHFPGHGDTHEDSHHRTTYVNKTLEELREADFVPFVAGIAAGADMVMTGHLIVPDIDELPATLSKVLITDILRDELGFDGVVITDSLAMNAISRNYSVDYVAVTAINAGIDILLMPVNVDETIDALIAAVENKIIPESRIDESLSRIIRLKISLGIIEL